jgi:hypothetical protein
MRRKKVSSEYTTFEAMLKRVLSREAKARVDADKEKRKRVKTASEDDRASHVKGKPV